ncbi:hypothetical protein L7F22_020048 [Adiantum nelumboides]|nr:hypothetical protein [Adiantum nelumboides]
MAASRTPWPSSPKSLAPAPIPKASPPLTSPVSRCSLPPSTCCLPNSIKTGGVPLKFGYCLRPGFDNASPAPLFLGNGISYMFGLQPYKINVSALLGDPFPLKFDKEGRLYMGVTDIRINKELVKRGSGKLLKMRVSTTEPWTKLSHQVYVAMCDKFGEKAEQMGMQRVENPLISRLPFETCYNESSVGWDSKGYHQAWAAGLE